MKSSLTVVKREKNTPRKEAKGNGEGKGTVSVLPKRELRRLVF